MTTHDTRMTANQMRICVCGLGYVGAVTAACLARLGHRVVGIDPVQQKVELINGGRPPISEPGLEPLIVQAVEAGMLRASTAGADAIGSADVVLVCVGTPSRANGEVDTSVVERVAGEIAAALAGGDRRVAVIFRSTVPPGTLENLIVPRFASLPHASVLYHPEFLREGAAVADFFDRPLVVAASGDQTYGEPEAAALFARLYAGMEIDFRWVSPRSAEMIKYINNGFHALKVAWANEIGRIARGTGVDAHEVTELFLADRKLNISPAYLRPGFAYGGSCLPKDLRGLQHLARQAGVEAPIIENVAASNRAHIALALDLILESACRRIAFLGLTFKPRTDDVRESPLVYLVEQCLGKGLGVRIADESIELAALTGRNLAFLEAHLHHIGERLVPTPAEAIEYAELVVLGHAEPAYLAALEAFPGKRVLDLTGQLTGAGRSERIDSIVVNRQASRV